MYADEHGMRREERYNIRVHVFGRIDDPGHELEEEELSEYMDTKTLWVRDWTTTPAGDGMVELSVEGTINDAAGLYVADELAVDCGLEVEVTEYETEEVWCDC